MRGEPLGRSGCQKISEFARRSIAEPRDRSANASKTLDFSHISLRRNAGAVPAKVPPEAILPQFLEENRSIPRKSTTFTKLDAFLRFKERLAGLEGEPRAGRPAVFPPRGGRADESSVL